MPALRELMPMDVRDDGFRHVGRCAGLETLWCMYCRARLREVSIETSPHVTADAAAEFPPEVRVHYAP